MIKRRFPPAFAALLAFSSLATTLSVHAQEVTEWVPTLVILPFRELGPTHAGDGMTVADWLTVRFAASESHRVVDRTAEAETAQELEIGLASEGAAKTSERMGVDGVVTGDLLVFDGRRLLCAKLTSLTDESFQGLWVEVPVDQGLEVATDGLTAKLEPIVRAWARDQRARRVEAGAERTRRLDAMKEVAGLPWAVALEEHFDRDYRLFAGVAEASVIEVLQQAGGRVRSTGEGGATVAPGTLALRGTAHCTVPVHRDGRSVARAVCSLRLEDDGGVVLDDASVVRSFAAPQAREAGYAALQAAGEAAALSLLERHVETLRRRAKLGLAPQKPSRSPAAKPKTSPTAVEKPTLRSDDEALRRLNAAVTPFERLAALQGTVLPFEAKIREVEATLRQLPDPQRDVPGALCLELAQGFADRGRWAEGYPWLVRMRDSRNPISAGTEVSQWALRSAQATEVGSNIVQRYVAIMASLDQRARIDGLPLLRIAEQLRAEGRPREAAEIARHVSRLGLFAGKRPRQWGPELDLLESLVLGFEVVCRFESDDSQGAASAFLPFKLRGGLDNAMEPTPEDGALRPFSPETYRPAVPFCGNACRTIRARLVSPALSVLPLSDERFAAAYRDAYARRTLPPEWHFEQVLEQMERGDRSTAAPEFLAMQRLQELHQHWLQWVSGSEEERDRIAKRLAKLPRVLPKGFGRAWPLPDAFVPQTLPPEWTVPLEICRLDKGDAAMGASPLGLVVDVIDIGDPLLLAAQELAALRAVASKSGIRPLIRTIGNEAEASSGLVETHSADLLRPAGSALVLSRCGDALWGQSVDVRDGELLAVASASLSKGVGVAVESLVDRLLPTFDLVPEKEHPARWLGLAPIGACPAVEVQAALLQIPGVRILPRDIGWLLKRERDLGLGDTPLLKADVELRGETTSARQRGVDGSSVWLVAEPCDGTARGEETLFIPAGTSTNEVARRVADRFVALSREAPVRVSQPSPEQTRGVLGAKSDHPTLGLLTQAHYEAEAQRAEDWYRLYPGNYDDAEVRALKVSQPGFEWVTHSRPDVVAMVVRAATARLRWELANGRKSTRRMADRNVVADAWFRWREVPLHAAERLTMLYLQAYYERDDPDDIASPDVLLVLEPFSREYGHGEKTPPFRRRQFFACLRASSSPGGRLLGADEAMLEALLDPKSVTPDAFADASIRLLSTTNGLSRFLTLRLERKARGGIGEGYMLAWSDNKFDPAISMMLHTHDKEYGPYAVRLRQAWTDYLGKAPRPLPEPLRVQLRRHLGNGTIRGVLEASLHDEDGVLPPAAPAGVPPDPVPATEAPTVDWPAEWLPPPPSTRHLGEVAACWNTGRRLYSVWRNRTVLQVHWCDLETGEWGEGAEHAATLPHADNAVFDDRTQMLTLGRQHYLHLRNDSTIWELKDDGTLLKTQRFPALDALIERDKVVGYGDGVLVTKTVGGRVLYWDRTQDTLKELANARSTRPGGLNNHPSWTPLLLTPSTKAGTFDLLLDTSVSRPGRSGPAVEHWTLHVPTGDVRIVRASEYAPSIASAIAFDAFFAVAYGKSPDHTGESLWHLWPRDPAQPPVVLCGTEAQASMATSQARLVVNRGYGPEAAQRTLLLFDDLTSGTPRCYRVTGARFPRSGLFRVGNDLVVMGRTRGVRDGIQRVRDAFTRELPPEGTDIQLREVEFTRR